MPIVHPPRLMSNQLPCTDSNGDALGMELSTTCACKTHDTRRNKKRRAIFFIITSGDMLFDAQSYK